MYLTWPMKFRIAASIAAGVIIIGIFAWPLVAPPDPYTAISLSTSDISPLNSIILAIVAFLTGLIAYFASWPYGWRIAPVAVPAGMTIWAVRTGSMADLIRLNPTLDKQQAVFDAFKFESFYWLAVIAIGFFGILLAQKLSGQKIEPDQDKKKSNSKSGMYLTPLLALIISVVVAVICLGVCARDINIFDSKLDSVVAQPAKGQVIFAVIFSFMVAAFVVKKFLKAGYLWSIIATVFVTAFAVITYTKQDILQHIVGRYPTVFFSNPIITILPLQMVALGALGSIIGYWGVDWFWFVLTDETEPFETKSGPI